jgi:transcriptional regulator with XRE-family HTH domain
MKHKEAFAKWLERQYIEWMSDRGEVASQREFAEFIGIDPMNLSNYLNAKRRMPDQESIKKIAEKLGPEVYDVLGLARPDPQLQRLTSMWHKLDQETKNRILNLAKGKK